MRKSPFIAFTLAALLAVNTLSGVAWAQLPDSITSAVDLSSRYRIVPNITYAIANNFDAKLDLYLPWKATGPNPTLIYIHGGGWVVGTKEGAQIQVLPYLEMGWSVVNVEYRLAKVSLAPAAVEDCRRALRWVMSHAKEYNLDTNKIVVTGHSAGGHLALMTGMLSASAGLDTPPEWFTTDVNLKVSAIINWFGITDVEDLLEGSNMKWYAVAWMGSMTNREEIAKRVSPINYVREGLPPILTIHGDNDELVPYSHAVRLHEKLSKAGVPNQLLTISGGKHGGFTREENLKAYAAIREFLSKYVLGTSH
ncbi:MAG: alpha/beta hydrolase [Bacteroidota bacterium]